MITVRSGGVVRSIFAGLLVLNLHSPAVAQQGGPHEFREIHLGMEVRLLIAGEPDAAADAARLAFDLVDSLDLILSDWRPDSELMKVTTAPAGQWKPVSDALGAVLALSLEVADASEGKFDPTVGPLSVLWRESRRTGEPIVVADREEAMALVGWQLIDLDRENGRVRLAKAGMRLDLGGIAKGWILDRVAEALTAWGHPSALVEAGGEVVVTAPPPGRDGWLISVKRPMGDTTIVLIDGALSSSGPSEQWIVDAEGTRRSHVIRTSEGRGSSSVASVTVTGASGAVTDAIATTLTLVKPSQRAALLERFGVRLVAGTTSSGADPR